MPFLAAFEIAAGDVEQAKVNPLIATNKIAEINNFFIHETP